jgi:hypothetical protein
MSHFAKVLDGKVIQVIVAEPEFFDTFIDSSAGTWIQTSYNTYGNQHPEGRPLRGNYAGIGFNYDSIKDVFYAPQPYPSWVLNETTWLWEAPTTYPDDGKDYNWDEAKLSWAVIE